MSKILITGANGFIGSNLLRSLSKSKNEIIIFVRKNSKLWRISDLTSKFDIRDVDLLNKDILRRNIKSIEPEIVYHCVTHGLHPSQKNLITILQTNIVGTANLMETLSEQDNLGRIINIGSSYEYGIKSGPITETSLIKPITPYGIAKASQTQIASYFAMQKKLPLVTLRVFTAYGMFEDLGHLISDILHISLTKEKVSLNSSKIKRDFIFIDDVVDALKKASIVPEIEGKIFNIGSGQAYSAKKIIDIVEKITKTNLKTNIRSDRVKKNQKIQDGGFADIKKANKIMKWKPKFSIEKGLEKTYQWHKKNLNLYL